jgi:hypothetical protein
MSIPFTLNLTVATWNRESDGLFDYHSHSVAVRSFTVQGPAKVLRKGEDCTVVSLSSKGPPDYESLLVLAENQGRCFIQPEQETWLAAGKGSKRWPGAAVRLSDFIRFGRTVYKVVSLSAQASSSNLDPTLISEPVDLDAEAPGKKSACRICLSDEESSDNLLLSPCHCDGSVKFIHFRCLQEWMKSKCDVKTKGCITRCILHRLECELCKTVLPDQLYVQGRYIDMHAFTHSDQPHVTLEEVVKEEEGNDARTLYILSFEEGRPMRVGRGRECDIRIRDFAVSRVNSLLKLEKGQFLLVDKGSKFGSLKAISHPVALVHLPVMFQVDRTLVTIEEPKSSWIRSLCCCGEGERPRQSESEEELVREKKRHRLDTRVAPFEVTESDSYVNMPNCVQG